MVAFKLTPFWGTLPDWLAALGTVGAFFAGLRLLRKELDARREQEEDRRRAQARLVAAWVANKQSSASEWHSYVVMKNGSEEPVYDGLAIVVMSTSRFSFAPEAISDGLATWEIRWVVLPPQETKESVLSGSGLSPWEFAIELSFTDSQGRRWKRLTDGALTEVTKGPRRSRKDQMNAWIAGELDHLDY